MDADIPDDTWLETAILTPGSLVGASVDSDGMICAGNP